MAEEERLNEALTELFRGSFYENKPRNHIAFVDLAPFTAYFNTAHS